MKKIFKYPLELKDEQTINLPLNSVVLSVVNQREIVTLYAVIDETQIHKETYNIRIFGTEHVLSLQNHKFLGTVTCNDGELIWHIYYRKD